MKLFKILLVLSLTFCASSAFAATNNPLPGSAGVVSYAPADASGSITTGGSFQQVFASNGSRVQCHIHNPLSAVEPLYVHFHTGTATVDNSETLGRGGDFYCNGNGTVVTTAIQVTAATSGHKFMAGGS